MTRPVKIGIAGTGFGRKVALPVYRELEQFDPVACWSRSRERASKLSEEANLQLGTSDFEELLSVPGLEAVHIATPVATHLEFATAAARRGLHVLCEKPLAGNLADATAIAQAVRDSGVVGAVGFGLRLKETRSKVIERAREVAGQPRMILISLVHSDHADPNSRPYTWVHDARMGGGRLQGYGVHDLDLLLEVFPDVEAVAAATDVGVPFRQAENGEPRAVTSEDAYAVLIRFRGGGLGVVSLVATARHERKDLIEIYGDRGTVRLDADYRVWWGRNGEELKCEGPYSNSSSDAFSRIALNFWASIREGKPSDPSIQEALRVQAVFDAAHTANVERRWVRPEPVAAES